MKQKKRYFFSITFCLHPRDWKIILPQSVGETIPFILQIFPLIIQLTSIPDTPHADATLLDSFQRTERTHDN